MRRGEIKKILKEIAPPGEKQDEKIEAVKKLKLKNFQGYDLVESIQSFKEF